MEMPKSDCAESELSKARKMLWLFVEKGKLQPFLISYNSVMWPLELSINDKVKLRYCCPTDVKLVHQSRKIDCTLKGVINKSTGDDVLRAINNVKDDGESSEHGHVESQLDDK